MLTIKNWNKKRKWGYKKYHQLQCRCGRRMRIYWEKKEIEWFARWCQQCVDPFDLLANIAINGSYEFWLLLWNCIVVCTGLFIVKVALFCKCSWHHPIALANCKFLHHLVYQLFVCNFIRKVNLDFINFWCNKNLEIVQIWFLERSTKIVSCLFAISKVLYLWPCSTAILNS